MDKVVLLHVHLLKKNATVGWISALLGIIALIVSLGVAAGMRIAVTSPGGDILPLVIVFIIFMIITIALLITSLVSEIRCILNAGYLKQIVAQKDSEFTSLLPFTNNCQIYAIISIFVPFVFTLILAITANKQLFEFSMRK